MMYAVRGNRICQISDADASRYIEMGYDIQNEQGVVIHESVPNDMLSLKSAFTRHAGQIQSLRNEVAQLKAELAEAKAELSKMTTKESATPVVADSAVTEEVKPKRKRKTSADKLPDVIE